MHIDRSGELAAWPLLIRWMRKMAECAARGERDEEAGIRKDTQRHQLKQTTPAGCACGLCRVEWALAEICQW